MDDWADGHGFGSGHRTQEEVAAAMNEDDSVGDAVTELVTKETEAQVSSVLEKATRESRHGELSGVMPESVASALSGIRPMGVPLTDKEKADKARAKELVAELFERVPWDDFMEALDERGHVLKTVKALRAEGQRLEAYRSEHRNIAHVARSASETAGKLLSAAQILMDGLYVEEGDPEAVKALLNRIESEGYTLSHALQGSHKKLRDVEEKYHAERG